MDRLVIDVPGKQHQQLKAMAALHGRSLEDFVIDRLFPDDEEAAMKELSNILLTRIEAAEKGGVSDKTIRQAAEEKARELGVL
jgi:plasmid stability protein